MKSLEIVKPLAPQGAELTTKSRVLVSVALSFCVDMYGWQIFLGTLVLMRDLLLFVCKSDILSPHARVKRRAARWD
jgi:hypothetical protein